MTATIAKTTSQIRLERRTPAYWRVTIDNAPLNVMGPQMVKEFQGVMHALGSLSSTAPSTAFS
jgi:hypothetical protein